MTTPTVTTNVNKPTQTNNQTNTQTQNNPQTQTQSLTNNSPSTNTNTNTNDNPVTVTTTNSNPISITTPVNVNNTVNIPAPAATQQTVEYVTNYPQSYNVPTPVYQNVSCSITASPNSIVAGGTSYLGWSSTNASSASISGIGPVSISGSLAIHPYTSQTYTMTVYGTTGGSATCTASVSVVGYVAPATVGTEVSLTQIPYTGFDFGTFGDSIYWLALLGFAGAASYLMIYYKGGAAVFAGSMFGGNSNANTRTVRAAMSTPVAPVVPALAQVATPVARTLITADEMNVVHSSGNEAPRIVISRA